LIILIMFDEEYKLWSSPLRSFSSLVSLHLSSVQIFSSAPCSQTPPVYVPPLMLKTLRLRSSLNTRDQVSHPYRTTGKMIVFYIQIFMFLNNRRADKHWMVVSITRTANLWHNCNHKKPRVIL
jgi:hypothetical protein